MKSILAFINDESGATAIEYALVASIIALGIFSTQTQIAPGLNSIFNDVVTLLSN